MKADEALGKVGVLVLRRRRIPGESGTFPREGTDRAHRLSAQLGPTHTGTANAKLELKPA